jgi:hypothetical protein
MTAPTTRCARTGGPRGQGPCLARGEDCTYCTLAVTRLPAREQVRPVEQRRRRT